MTLCPGCLLGSGASCEGGTSMDLSSVEGLSSLILYMFLLGSSGFSEWALVNPVVTNPTPGQTEWSMDPLPSLKGIFVADVVIYHS